MVAHLLVTAVLVAANPPFSIAIPGLNSVRLAPGEGELYANLLSQKLYRRGAKVISPRDLGAVIGLERQKQLLDPSGCNESCTAELAAALGVDTLLVGDIGRPGSKYTVTLKLLSSKDAAVLAVHSATDIDVDAMPQALDRAAYDLLKQISTLRADVSPGTDPSKAEPAVGTVASSGGGLRRTWALAPAVVGVVAVVAGGVCVGLSRGQLSALRAATSEPDARAARDSGSLLQTAGWVGVAIGAAALVAAGVVFLVGDAAPVTPTVAVTPGGVGLGLVWSVP
jgi:hypothetical protein